MIYGLYHSAAGMLVNQVRQDVIANNLANVDTAGFKRDMASFSERLVEAQSRSSATRNAVLDGQTGGVWSAPTHTDWQDGPTEVTGNPLDVAISGRGFFAVQTPDGVRYTRDGAFTIDSQNRLVTSRGGWPVLSSGGHEIAMPEDAKSVGITVGGQVLVNDRSVADLQVADFDPAKIRKVGGNLIEGAGEPTAIAAHLRPASIEKSNVEAMGEMASMIAASRAYQMNAQMVTLQDGTLGRLISEVARPTG